MREGSVELTEVALLRPFWPAGPISPSFAFLHEFKIAHGTPMQSESECDPIGTEQCEQSTSEGEDEARVQERAER